MRCPATCRCLQDAAGWRRYSALVPNEWRHPVRPLEREPRTEGPNHPRRFRYKAWPWGCVWCGWPRTLSSCETGPAMACRYSAAARVVFSQRLPGSSNFSPKGSFVSLGMTPWKDSWPELLANLGPVRLAICGLERFRIFLVQYKILNNSKLGTEAIPAHKRTDPYSISFNFLEGIPTSFCSNRTRPKA